MSELLIRHAGSRQGRILAGALLVAVGIGAVALLPLVAEPASGVREIVLVSRNMKFYLEGESTPNPTIRVEPGEQVRFILRNADPGFVHWFAIDAWGGEGRSAQFQ